MADYIKNVEVFEQVEDWLENAMYEKLKCAVKKFPEFLSRPYDFVNQEKELIVSDVLNQLLEFLDQNCIDLKNLEYTWGNMSTKSCRTGVSEKFKYLNMDCTSASSGHSLESKISTTDIPILYNKKNTITELEKFSKNKGAWLQNFANNIFNMQFHIFVANQSITSDDNKIINRYVSSLTKYLSPAENQFMEDYFSNLMEEAAIQIACRQPKDTRAYLGHFILVRKYSENYKDLNIRDVEHLVKLREHRICSESTKDRIRNFYLCDLLDDKNVIGKNEFKYDFNLNSKIRLFRGKRLSPKLKKITNMLTEKNPMLNVSKRIRNENIFKEIASGLNKLLSALRCEVDFIIHTETARLYEDLMQILNTLSSDVKSNLKNKTRSAPAHKNDYSHIVEDSITAIKMLQVGIKSASSRRPESSVKLPDINEKNNSEIEQPHQPRFKNLISSEDKFNLITKIEQTIKNTQSTMQSISEHEREYLYNELKNIFQSIIDSQYQSITKDTSNNDDCLTYEAIPLLETVLQFETDQDKCMVIDKIKEYLQQLVHAQELEIFKNKENILQIAKIGIKRAVKGFSNKTKAIAEPTVCHNAKCSLKFKQNLNLDVDFNLNQLLYNICVIFEEININYAVLRDLENVSKKIILAAPDVLNELERVDDHIRR